MPASELGAWKALGLDEPSLVRAHGHVMAARAGVERGALRRTLITGALRTGPVVSNHRTGRRVVFMHANELSAKVATVAASFDSLPRHTFMRAAWICEVLGAIHPFIDANGGTARFLSSLELARGWLPPLALSSAARNGAYLDAIILHDLGALELAVYGVVQQELGRLLLGEGGAAGEWDGVARGRADRWEALVDEAWRVSAGGDVDRDAPGAAGLARLARRGYRLPHRPPPRCVRWRTTSPVPVQLELAVAPVVGGGRPWTVAVLGASVGDDGVLGPHLRREQIASVFVAAADEDDAVGTARFQRWLDVRVDQCKRGLGAWM